MAKYVIIGNSAAGIGAVEGIRSTDKSGSITVISDEKYHTYSRPLISYLLYGKTDLNRMKYRPDDFYLKNGTETLFDKKAVKIDAASKTVFLESGETVQYEKLCAATGSRPFVPPIKGLDGVKNKFTFMTLDDALALQKVLDKSSKVLIVGAGLIGLKCAEGIADKAGSITVIDLAERILPSVLDVEGSLIVRRKIEEKGIKFILGDSAAEFRGNVAVTNKNGEIPFDILVMAVGVRPNTELLKQAGAETVKGIITDDRQLTSLKDIYAAGDLTESYDITANARRILALLPNAYMQGFAAGVNMAGGDKKFENAIPMNAVGFFGYHIITAGSYTGESFKLNGDGEFKELFTEDGVLKGFIMIGDVRRAGIYTALIRNRTPLDKVDFEAIKLKPQLIAFDAKARADMLGREV